MLRSMSLCVSWWTSWEFLTGTTDSNDELFREVPESLMTSASGASISPGPECSTSEFRSTNDEELKRLVGNNYNSNTAASTKIG